MLKGRTEIRTISSAGMGTSFVVRNHRAEMFRLLAKSAISRATASGDSSIDKCPVTRFSFIAGQVALALRGRSGRETNDIGDLIWMGHKHGVARSDAAHGYPFRHEPQRRRRNHLVIGALKIPGRHRFPCRHIALGGEARHTERLLHKRHTTSSP